MIITKLPQMVDLNVYLGKKQTFLSLVSIYLIMAPDWFFTIDVYSYSGTSFAWNSSYTNKWIVIKLLQMVTLIRSCARSKAFDIGSVFTRLCPWLVFTIYTCNWKSIVWPTSRPLSQLCAHWCRVDKSS